MNDLLFDNRIAGLFIKFLQDDITEAEKQELNAWAGSSDRAKQIFDELTNEEKLPDEIALFTGSRERVLAKIHEAVPETRMVVEMRRSYSWRPWVAAAAMVGLAVAGYFLLVQNKTTKQPAIVKQNRVTNDIAPGKDGAILKLADNRTIVLDELKDGEVVKLGNVIVSKEGGKLIYKPTQEGNSDLEYNLMTTPKGRTYRVELSDGSVAYLNAASSLSYPIVFGKNERRVVIKGEVAFDVVKDASRKFIVEAHGISTEVLGTSFNINCYDDEADLKVTLIEGSIKVNKEASKSVILKPGEQASVSEKSESIPVKKVDVDEVIAWKNGLFKFESTPMEEMMRQISRWYDVEVVIEGAIKDEHVTGEMKRNTNASEALEILKAMGYKFTIDGKKITVTP